jgi:hypothetical protein
MVFPWTGKLPPSKSVWTDRERKNQNERRLRKNKKYNVLGQYVVLTNDWKEKQLEPDGTFKRPVGKSLKGKKWDPLRGAWIPEGESLAKVPATPAEQALAPVIANGLVLAQQTKVRFKIIIIAFLYHINQLLSLVSTESKCAVSRSRLQWQRRRAGYLLQAASFTETSGKSQGPCAQFTWK